MPNLRQVTLPDGDYCPAVAQVGSDGQVVESVPAGATLTSVSSGTGDVQAVIATTGLRLVGFSCRENAAAAAEFVLRAGTSSGAPAIAFVKLAAGESVREWFGDGGIACAAGLFLDRVSGTTEVTVYTRTGS